MPPLPELSANFLHGALAIEPERVVDFVAASDAIRTHEHASEMASPEAHSSDDFWPTSPQDWRAALRPYDVREGILHLRVQGVLLHDFPWQLGAFATGYQFLQRAFERGVADYRAGQLKGIAMLINSPGGMVAGCFDAIDRVFDLKQSSGVPVQCFSDNHAFSAAYAWATVGDRFTVSRTSSVGSIGVVRTHVSRAGFNEKQGVAYTFVHAGKHKVDGNAEEPLPADVRARWQAEVEELNDIFVATVVRNRGMSAEAVRATQAGTFTASRAIKAGLADAVASMSNGLKGFTSLIGAGRGASASVAVAAKPSLPTAAPVGTVTGSARSPEWQAAYDEAYRAAGERERDRIKGIIRHPEADGRYEQAQYLALNTSMSVEEAGEFLALGPRVASHQLSSDGLTPFERAMARNNPNVGSGLVAEWDGDMGDGSSEILELARSIGMPGVRPRSG